MEFFAYLQVHFSFYELPVQCQIINEHASESELEIVSLFNSN